MGRPKKELGIDEEVATEVAVEDELATQQLTETSGGSEAPTSFLSDEEKQSLTYLSNFLQSVYSKSNNIPDRTAINLWRSLLGNLVER